MPFKRSGVTYLSMPEIRIISCVSSKSCPWLLASVGRGRVGRCVISIELVKFVRIGPIAFHDIFHCDKSDSSRLPPDRSFSTLTNISSSCRQFSSNYNASTGEREREVQFIVITQVPEIFNFLQRFPFTLQYSFFVSLFLPLKSLKCINKDIGFIVASFVKRISSPRFIFYFLIFALCFPTSN